MTRSVQGFIVGAAFGIFWTVLCLWAVMPLLIEPAPKCEQLHWLIDFETGR